MSTIKVNALRHTGGSSDNINLDSSSRVLVGTSSAISTTALGAARAQIVGTDNVSSQLSISRFSADSDRARLVFVKSRSGTIGTNTIVQDDDAIGRIEFLGADGSATNDYPIAAHIGAFVDGTPGADDMPGRLSFSTTADGASSPTEAVRIDSSQNLLFNSGYGSVATAYGCRAWCNADLTGSGSIRDSGNISSLGDQGTGRWQFNFATAMPDDDYAANGICQPNADIVNNAGIHPVSPSYDTYTTGTVCFIYTNDSGTLIDPLIGSMTVHR